MGVSLKQKWSKRSTKQYLLYHSMCMDVKHRQYLSVVIRRVVAPGLGRGMRKWTGRDWSGDYKGVHNCENFMKLYTYDVL